MNSEHPMTRAMEMMSDKPITGISEQEILDRISAVVAKFYPMARHTESHAFLEFTGLMAEYLKILHFNYAQGGSIRFSSKHSEAELKTEPYHIKYIAEKFDCIFSPAFTSKEARLCFLMEMGWANSKGELF